MCRKLLLAIFAVALVHSGFGQGYTIQTVAGRDWDMPAVSSNLSTISAVAADSEGNVYLALREYAVVVRIDPAGQLSLIAGNGVPGYSGDNGPANLAQLQSPTALAADAAGTVYIADSGNVRKVSNGVITTVAGASIPSLFPPAEIPATGIAVNSAGNLYVAVNGRVIEVSNGVATTVAGGGGGSFGDNSPAVGAALIIAGIAVDDAGNLYLADICSKRIRKVSNGVLTTVAGNGSTAPSLSCPSPVVGGADGHATSVSLDTPNGVAVDAAGNVYFTEGLPHVVGNSMAGGRVRKVSNGNLITVAGGGTCGIPINCAALSDNVAGTAALLGSLNSVAIDSSGSIYFPDGYLLGVGSTFSIFNELGRLRKVSDGVITTVAGTLGPSGEGGPATGAQLVLPAGITVDAAGNLYIADSANNMVREVSSGVIITVAGNRTDGLFRPRGVAFDPARGLYITDGSSVLKTVNGNIGVLLSYSQLNANIANIALDVAGNLYIADTTGNRILEVSNAGITTVAGNGVFGFAGDNGPATDAQLAGPSGVALDNTGNIYFTDVGNQRIRKIANGVITTVAGNGATGFSGDNGPATSAQLNLPPLGCPNNRCDAQLPSGIAVDAAGNIYFADSGNHRVRKISVGVITSLAGNGMPGFSGDAGPASGAVLNTPSGIAVDSSSGKVYIADSGNNRIRVLVPPQPSGAVPAISLVANAFGESRTIAPNTWVEIKGVNLASLGDVRAWQGSDFVNNQLPAALDGVSVAMNGKNAYVYYISPIQINVLTPADLTPLGAVQVIVTVKGVVSAAFASQAQPISPSFFVLNGGPYVTAVHADGSLIGPLSLYPGLTLPAKPGETIALYANGFGQTSPPVVIGSASQAGSLPTLPLVKVGGAAATVQFAGLISPGLYQFNVTVPASAPDGDNAVVATYNGVTTPSGTLLTVQH